jgi:signal transduction histidine kinase
VTGSRELRHLSQAFDDMAETLERSMGETKQALGTLHESRARLLALSRSLIGAQEAERHQLARELHDEIGQALTAVGLKLDALLDEDPNPEQREHITEASGVVKHAIDQVRDLSLDLRPSILDDLGLVAALRWYVRRQAEQTGLEIELDAQQLDTRPAPEVETACFRIVQEALTNVARHARARRVKVEVADKGGRVECVVRDDGQGFDVERAQEGARRGGTFGLNSMEERAELAGGTLQLSSTPGRGTEVRARLPLQPVAGVEAYA